MDFGQILDTWDKQHKNSKSVENTRSESSTAMADEDTFEVKDQEIKDEYPDKQFRERAACQDELDLHGQTQEEARTNLKSFLNESWQEGLRKILIVHGKGLHTQTGESVLRNLVPEVLQSLPFILDYGQANKAQGGKGATWVYFKHKQ